MDANKYILRKAAGTYWLLDVSQTGLHYKRPLEMNGLGADIWKMYSEGIEEGEIIRIINKEYDVDISVVREDVKEFLEQLIQFGVSEVR